jgi:regulator of protease activity HflC (stomatin/prohibitin superfamily)
VTPFVDKVRYVIDMREQVVSFPPQPVITEDNLVVSIDTVIYFQVTDPVAATVRDRQLHPGRRAAHHDHAAQHRRWHGPRADADQPRGDQPRLRGVLDEATGKWGIRVNRVEIKGIDPPPSIKDSMEKQMRADRDKRRVILTAEGQRQSAILTAEGNKQSRS